MRWNSPYINHFIQPDTIIPDQTNPQSWDRYAYVRNNPLRFTDPTGHKGCDAIDENGTCQVDQFWNWHNNNKLHPSSELLTFVKTKEGTVKEGDIHILYPDPSGNCTIGYGHKVHDGLCNGDPSESEFLSGISEDEANQLLSSDIESAVDAVRSDTTVPLTQEEFDALVSFTYNVGAGDDGFNGSTLLEDLNAGNYDIRDNLNDWIYAWDDTVGQYIEMQGLIERRHEEGEIFWYWFYR